jgi:hypothetical protein
LLRWTAGRRRDERDIVSAGKVDRVSAARLDRAPARRDHEPIDDKFHDASVLVETSRCKNVAFRISSV